MIIVCPCCRGREHRRKSCEFGCAFGFIMEADTPHITDHTGRRIRTGPLRCRRERFAAQYGVQP